MLPHWANPNNYNPIVRYQKNPIVIMSNLWQEKRIIKHGVIPKDIFDRGSVYGYVSGNGNLLQDRNGNIWRVKYKNGNMTTTTKVGRPKRRKGSLCDKCWFRWDRISGPSNQSVHLTCFQELKVSLLCLMRIFPRDIAYMIIWHAFGTYLVKIDQSFYLN